MDHLDEARWRGLLAAYRNARDAAPPVILIQEAQGRWARAGADLERYRAGGPAAQTKAYVEAFDEGCRELELRVAAAESEMRRIESHATECAAKRSALYALVEACRQWARSQQPPVVLPGDESSSIMSGFGASVRIPSSPAAQPFAGVTPPPIRQGGQRVWP